MCVGQLQDSVLQPSGKSFRRSFFRAPSKTHISRVCVPPCRKLRALELKERLVLAKRSPKQRAATTEPHKHSHSHRDAATEPQRQSDRARATEPRSHRATEPQHSNAAADPQSHSHRATQPQRHSATEPRSHRATEPQSQSHRATGLQLRSRRSTEPRSHRGTATHCAEAISYVNYQWQSTATRMPRVCHTFATRLPLVIYT